MPSISSSLAYAPASWVSLTSVQLNGPSPPSWPSKVDGVVDLGYKTLVHLLLQSPCHRRGRVWRDAARLDKDHLGVDLLANMKGVDDLEDDGKRGDWIRAFERTVGQGPFDGV